MKSPQNTTPKPPIIANDIHILSLPSTVFVWFWVPSLTWLV
jgi:hypothetical protein